MRLAGERDFALLCAWQSAFLDEIAARETAEEVPQLVRRRLNLGGAWIWEAGGEPVAHAGHRPTPVRSARIAPVYTPPGHRGRGYATALVATLARHLLDQGHRPLYLFADTLNPTSNGIYRRVGFQPAGDHLHLTRVGGA
jgi:predicted GNAT family acetyltransferase